VLSISYFVFDLPISTFPRFLPLRPLPPKKTANPQAALSMYRQIWDTRRSLYLVYHPTDKFSTREPSGRFNNDFHHSFFVCKRIRPGWCWRSGLPPFRSFSLLYNACFCVESSSCSELFFGLRNSPYLFPKLWWVCLGAVSPRKPRHPKMLPLLNCRKVGARFIIAL
jgi:hypothetical protein